MAEEFDVTQEGSVPEKAILTPYGMLSTKDIIFAVLPDGRKLLVHGQHLLAIGVETGVPLKAKIVHAQVADEHAAQRLHEELDAAEAEAIEEHESSLREE